jgi:hypothetical protein
MAAVLLQVLQYAEQHQYKPECPASVLLAPFIFLAISFLYCSSSLLYDNILVQVS